MRHMLRWCTMISAPACKSQHRRRQKLPSTIVERIKTALDDRRWTLKELAEKTDTPYRTLQHRMAGGALPAEWLADVAGALEVAPGWLLTGEGSPHDREEPPGDAEKRLELIQQLADRHMSEKRLARLMRLWRETGEAGPHPDE